MKKINLLFGAFALLAAGACGEDTKTEYITDPNTPVYGHYNVVWCDSDENNTGSLVQSFADITDSNTEISFVGKGTELTSTRSPYVFMSDDSRYLYNFSYGGGTFDKLAVLGNSNYLNLNLQMNLVDDLGSTHSRFSKLNDRYASGHHIITEPVFEADGVTYKEHKAVMNIVIVDLHAMTKSTVEKSIEIPNSVGGYTIWRVHMPVIQGDKIYYGVALGKFYKDGDSYSRDKTAPYDKAAVLVYDFPSLENPTLLQTGVANANGETYGYRAYPMYAYGGFGAQHDELYQLSRNVNPHILRIKDGAYDDSYAFDLKAELGIDASESLTTTGWHYVGDGIGYVPYRRDGLTTDSKEFWSIARVDLNNMSATEIDFGLSADDNLDLWEYQSGKIVEKDGKKYFAMTLCPEDKEGYIYLLDPTSTSSVGIGSNPAFVRGPKLVNGAGSMYVGIF